MSRAPLIYDKAMHEARKYWRDRLETMAFGGHVALDHPRPNDGERAMSSLELQLGEDVDALLLRITAGNAFLAYTALVLGLMICSSKYSGETGVTVFCPGTADGAAGGLLPIAGALDGGASFKDALLATKDLLSGAYRYQYPFSRMLLDMPEERRPKHLPLIASMAGFNADAPAGPSDIAVLFDTTGGTTKVTVRFDARLYDESTIEHFFASFRSVLKRGLGDMAIRVADLVPEYAAMPAAAAEGRDGAGLHRLVEAQVRAHPERIAVVDGARATTYAALDRQADRLAATLAGLKLDVRKPVVIVMDAGTELVVSMLAVMKAGAAFAPVKLLSSRRPIAEILRALECECIISRPEHVADLQRICDGVGIAHGITIACSAPVTGDGGAVLEITRNWGAFPANGQAGGAATAERAAGDERFGTACVLVDAPESGVSTSAVTHADLVRLFTWLNGRGDVGADDRCLLSPGLGACEQLYDTLGMLVAGAGVEIADAASRNGARQLAERLMAPQITVWDLPTPLVHNLMGDLGAVRADRPELRGPRAILLTGEKQSPALANELARWFPNARITGLYANPAVGIWTTAFAFGDVAANGAAVVAEAIPGFEHAVVNHAGEPAPAAVKGELQLRRGDVVKTGLRASPLDGSRMRWLRDASHRFLKAGCCVELTDLDAILCAHDDVRAAETIAVKPDAETGDLVVAFVLAEPDRLSPEAARDFLVLSDGVDLVPDRFIVLDEFPLTAEGAIDRDVLVKRFLAAHEPNGNARSIEVEKILRQLKTIWLEILQLDEVDDDDSFFARGGNSLKATLLIARIRDDFAVDLSVQDFFRKPSPRAVAQLIEAASKDTKTRQKGPDFKAVSREKYRVQLSGTES